MTETTINVERLPERLRPSVQAYAETIRQTAGADAAALVFHGLVVGGTFDPSTQPARNALVLHKIDLEMLRRLGAKGSRHARAGIAAPVIMTPDYISRSLDTFPLELLEIQQQQVLVFGKDYFGELSFQATHMRMQCERELKTALLAMQDGLLGTAGRERLVHGLAADAAEGLVRVLRGILWLKGIREARSTADTLVEVEKVVEQKLPGLLAALNPSHRHDWNTYQALYDDVARLGQLVDRW